LDFDDPLVSQLADGIIGTSMLADYIITINYPDSRIELTHKPAQQPMPFQSGTSATCCCFPQTSMPSTAI
jgi:hypothetical protein